MVKMKEPSTIGLVIRSGFHRKRVRFGTNLCWCRLEIEIGQNAGEGGSRSVLKQRLGQQRSKPTRKKKGVELLPLHLHRLVGCCGKSGISRLGMRLWAPETQISRAGSLMEGPWTPLRCQQAVLQSVPPIDNLKISPEGSPTWPETSSQSLKWGTSGRSKCASDHSRQEAQNKLGFAFLGVAVERGS